MAEPVWQGDAPELTPEEFRLFQTLFHERIGLKLSDQKKLMLRGRFSKRLRALRMPSFRAYYDLILPKGAAEWPIALDLITTHETYFFREPKHFDWLRETVLPNRTPGRALQIWSAACSSGEEPSSIAMVLHDVLGAHGWQVWASDIDAHMVEQAQRGVFREERIAGIPPDYLKRYCLRGTGRHVGQMRVDRCVREGIRHEVVNLLQVPEHFQDFDVIFLRNVIIYFDAATKARVLRDMCTRLRPGGWLFLGHSESLAGMDLPLCPVRPAIYQRRV